MKTLQNILGATRLAWFAAIALVAALCQPASYGDERLPKGHYKLTGVKVTPIEKTDKGVEKSNRLTREIRFDIETRFEIVKGTESLPFKVVNPTVAAKSSMTFDKAIKFKGENVPAGTNVLKYKAFDGSFFNVSMPDPFPMTIHSAIMKKDFALPADTYMVKFEWTTEQGAVFSDTVMVHIDVDLSASR